MDTQARDLSVDSGVHAPGMMRFAQGPSKDINHKIVHEAFRKIAAENPLAVAVEHNELRITYGELDSASTNLCRNLLRLGLRPRDRVILLVQRSIPMTVAILAVLKSGCQYIPLDGGVASDDALAHILSDTKASFALCLEKFSQRARQFAPSKTQVISLEDPRLQTAVNLEEGHEITVSPDDGAYIIYTSGESGSLYVYMLETVRSANDIGSTGKPKGVDVTHRNVTNLLTIAPGNLDIKPGRRVAQILSISFDMAAWEILGTLMNGGTLCIRNSDWAGVLKKVDTIIATPTILGTLKEEDYSNLRTIALAGEPCPSRLADQWARGRDFYNCCGPTEITIVNTMHKHHLGQPLTIGRPIPNTSVYILDENEQPVPEGASGIMWVGGMGVSRGYLNLPDLTGNRYKEDRFQRNGRMMFNTGDQCRWTEDGSLQTLGRIDDQVKIKGFRVELDGVSAVIESHPEIAKASALLIEGILCGFYVSTSPIDSDILKASSSKTLPYYAVPSKWIWLPEMPLTPNGKVDRKILRALGMTQQPEAMPAPLVSASASTLFTDSGSSKEDIAEKGIGNSSTTVTSLPISSSQETLNEKDFVLPLEKGAPYHMWLRYYFFSMYRRLFSIVFIGNLVTIVTIFSYRRTLNELQLSDLATATAANVTAALLMRQDYVVNLLFMIACSVPLWMPLFIRRNCAKVFHIGGIHSSAGVAAVFWFIILTVAATIGFAAPESTSLGKTDLAIVIVVYFILALCLSILVTAYPTFRAKHHDIFERVHRFSGWTILALFWVLVVLSANVSRGTSSLSKALRRDPTMYLLVISTISVILPWLRLRKVSVRSEVLSSHAIRLHFEYTNTYPGTAIRISERPLIEWHAFATVAKPGTDGFSLVVSNAGDWTKRQIGRVPSKLWVRGVPACGVLRIAPLFKSIILVATGSGIGPCLPVLLAKKVPMRVFWSTPNPEQTFGKDIMASVKGADPKAVIWNTRTQGKPDMVQEVWKLVAESGMRANGRWEVEAVCVIANKKVTQMVVRGMEVRGMAAYGAIFDS